MTIARNHTGHRVGEYHQHAKLTDEQVKAIRAANESGTGYKRLAKQYGVGISTIRDYCTYRTRWSA